MKSIRIEYAKSRKPMVNRTFFRTFLAIVAISALVACKSEPKSNGETQVKEEVSQETAALAFNDSKVGYQFQHYIHLKTALVNSDAMEAQSGAKMLMENTEDAALKELLAKMAASNEIEDQRIVFSEVTKKITEIVDASIATGEVYMQYCPMAFNNEGGYWLSTEKEIRNPYFGDRMLTCGKVTEIIK